MSNLTEMCSLWSFCRVMACKVAIRFEMASPVQELEATPAIMCYIACQPYQQPNIPDGLTFLSWRSLRQYITGNPRYCANRTLTAQYHGSGMLRLQKYMKIGSIINNPQYYNSGVSWDQPIDATIGPNANPIIQLNYKMGFLSQDANGLPLPVAVIYTLTHTYYVKFWQSRIEIS